MRKDQNTEEANNGIMDLEEEYADKLETLVREAKGEKSKDEEFDSNCLTRIIKEDGEIMVLQLHDQEQGNLVWKRTKIPNRRTCSLEMSMPLLMTVPKDVNRPEGGFVVAGVANKMEGRNINVGDLCLGQLQDQGPWAAEGQVSSVCPGGHCFIAFWTKLYSTYRIKRSQHMKIT